MDIKQHVTNLNDNIYVIFNLPPEVVAVLFAYVSRSPASFRDNLKKLIESKDIEVNQTGPVYDFASAKEKARKFHEKWVVGYGHSSVAEHAMASVAIEDVSIIASKIIEDNRLASYTEKSTRYQIFDRNRYYKPQKLMDSKYAALYEETCDLLFDTYVNLIDKAIILVKKKYPQKEGQSDSFYDSISKARACDVIRYLLPASTLTNLAMTANARVYEHAITKLESHQLEEAHDIGRKMKNEIQKVIPTLIKYADKNNYIYDTVKNMAKFSDREEKEQNNDVILIKYEKDAEDKLVEAILFRFNTLPYDEVTTKVEAMSDSAKLEVIDEFLNKQDIHDWPMRELEHVYYTFEITLDYGAFRDIQRHRICTQTTQILTTDYGYCTPDEIKEFGMIEDYDNAMKQAANTFNKIRDDFPWEAQYVVPLGYRIRTLYTWNLRQLFTFIKLRSGSEGHVSYRKIAIQLYEEIKKVHPFIAKYIKVSFLDGPSRG